MKRIANFDGIRGLAAVAAAAALLYGCGASGGEAIQAGSQVKMHYTLKVDGRVEDSSVGKDPLPFTQGRGMIIPGLDAKMIGLKAGDKREFTIEAEAAYGVRNPQAVQTMPRSKFPKDAPWLKAGAVVSGNSGGQEFRAIVVSANEKEVTLDLNHPLAGKTLNFSIEIVSVEKPA